jgi:hypothetical protein
MPALDNLTPFAASDFLSLTRAGEECLVLVVAGSFVLPAPGRTGDAPLAVCEAQAPPPETDVYWGEPGQSSLRYESQAVPHRPMTDVVMHAHAIPPGGKPASTSVVRLRVGALEKSALVRGARLWTQGAFGLTPTSPAPFTAMPLRYERAFGGASAGGAGPTRDTRNALADARGGGSPPVPYAPNPVGMGFYADEREALDQPLPFIEDPAAPIERVADRPPPCGFGPLARGTSPRLALAGTFDEAWIERRAPLWPLDFDERFFQAAPAGLRASPHLRGGESVSIEGVSPDGPIGFALPALRIAAKCEVRSGVSRRTMTLDTVTLEPDERRVVLTWRATFPMHRELTQHRRSVVRVLEPWEDAP